MPKFEVCSVNSSFKFSIHLFALFFAVNYSEMLGKFKTRMLFHAATDKFFCLYTEIVIMQQSVESPAPPCPGNSGVLDQASQLNEANFLMRGNFLCHNLIFVPCPRGNT